MEVPGLPEEAMVNPEPARGEGCRWSRGEGDRDVHEVHFALCRCIVRCRAPVQFDGRVSTVQTHHEVRQFRPASLPEEDDVIDEPSVHDDVGVKLLDHGGLQVQHVDYSVGYSKGGAHCHPADLLEHAHSWAVQVCVVQHDRGDAHDRCGNVSREVGVTEEGEGSKTLRWLDAGVQGCNVRRQDPCVQIGRETKGGEESAELLRVAEDVGLSHDCVDELLV